jgi:heat shock protein HspQ
MATSGSLPGSAILNSPMVTRARKTAPEKRARFCVGELVHHVLFDYRGVIIDVDMSFNGTDEWYAQMAPSRPPKDQPWYRVLVDGANHETYVAERNLEADRDGTPVKHPDIDDYFGEFSNGRYTMKRRQN